MRSRVRRYIIIIVMFIPTNNACILRFIINPYQVASQRKGDGWIALPLEISALLILYYT